MNFHYEKMQERWFEAELPFEKGAAAWMTLCLARTLKEWFGQPGRVYHREGTSQLQIGYEILSVLLPEFVQNAGPMLCGISREWPVQAFALADNNELIELSFLEADGRLAVRQKNISGVWCESLNDCCIVLQLPNELAAKCMCQLLDAVARGESVVALPWEHADFLKPQGLCAPDPTLSFCYVSLDGRSLADDPMACLSGLRPEQKESLWIMFLKKHLRPPEFEWLRNALLQKENFNWIEWHLALYRTLEQLGIRFICNGEQFELMDCNGQRLYFGVDHINAAEHVLMKILFPLNA